MAKRTRPSDLKIMCKVWNDPEWRALSVDAQWACIRSVAQLGLDCSRGGMQYRPEDMDIDPFVFRMVARELVGIGVWTFVDEDVVEVWPYRDLIYPFAPASWRRPIPQHVRDFVLERDGRACKRCGATEKLQMDHVYPWSLGGSDRPANLQTLCQPCNYRKGARVT